MKDKNVVILEGLVGEDLKVGKSTNGAGEYYTFTLCVNGNIGMDKVLSDNDSRDRSQTYIRCFVYDKKSFEYCRDVKLRKGKRVSILGKLVSYRSEVKGKVIVSLVVIVRDIGLIMTRKASREEVEEVKDKID